MEKRGLVEDNIWSRQSLPKGRQSREDRPFMDKEVAKPHSAEPHRASLYPIMLIAALSGARLDAVVSLKVRDVANGVLHFKAQKSEPDARDVPIHSRLKPMISRLVDGRAADEDLALAPRRRLIVGGASPFGRGDGFTHGQGLLYSISLARAEEAIPWAR